MIGSDGGMHCLSRVKPRNKILEIIEIVYEILLRTGVSKGVFLLGHCPHVVLNTLEVSLSLVVNTSTVPIIGESNHLLPPSSCPGVLATGGRRIFYFRYCVHWESSGTVTSVNCHFVFFDSCFLITLNVFNICKMVLACNHILAIIMCKCITVLKTEYITST